MRSASMRVLSVGILLLAFGMTGASAQTATSSPSRTSAVTGTVISSDGARLPRAILTLTSDTTGQAFHGTSDGLGAFVFDRLPADTYTLLVEFPGLSPQAVSAIVVGTAAVHLDVQLEPMPFREMVTVSAGVPRDSVEMTTVRESPARDVGELLADATGMAKLRKGAIASDVVLRGLQSRDLNVLIDGERLYGACPNHMDPPSFHVDFSQVERIDVGKGPFDVRYQGSLGGIVNIVTRRPEDGWKGNASVGVGSYGFVNPSTTVSYGGARVSALAGGSFRRSDPYTDGHGTLMTEGAGYRPASVDSDAFRATTAWGRVAWKPADGHQIEASYTRQQTDHILYPYLQMDAIWDNADRVSVDYDATTLGRWVSGFKGRAYWTQVDHLMTDQLRTSSGSAPRPYSMANDATSYTAGGRVEMQVHNTTIGGGVPPQLEHGSDARRRGLLCPAVRDS